MLQLAHVNKTYQAGTVNETTLFTDFNLEIRQGDFVTVVGSNGSGKTTLLNLICGTVSPDSGTILLDGTDITRRPEYQRSRQIGRVFQDPGKGSCAGLSIVENLAIAAHKAGNYGLQRAVREQDRRTISGLLEPLEMGLEKHLDQPCGTLSGGQRQALALLMSTINPPRLLILDEHTAALDPKASERIMSITADVVRRGRLTTLMVTHNLRYAIEYGNRLLMMHEGRIVRDNRGQDKADCELDDLLRQFNDISIETGN